MTDKAHHKKKKHHKKKAKDPKPTEDFIENDDLESVEDIETPEDPFENIEVPPSEPELYPKSYEARVPEGKNEPLSAKLMHKKKELKIAGVVGLILILLIVIIALAAKGDGDTIVPPGLGGSADFAAIHSSVGDVDRNDYESNLVSAMKGQPSMFDGLDGNTAHVQALNWLKKDRAAQGYAEDSDLDLLLEQYVLTLTVFMSTAHEWFDFFLPKHDSWCGLMGIHCNSDGRVSAIGIDGLDAFGVKGKIPTEIGFLTELVNLHVSWNGLIGTIPTEVGELSKLNSLNVYMASFTGTIPSEIENLRDLERLELWNMPYVTGTLPVEIFSRLNKLESLEIHNMKLSGTIPTQIRLTSLTNLWLEDLELSGSIPSEIFQLKELRSLHLSGCGLTGTIPEEIGAMALWLIDLDHNDLTGEVPEFFTHPDSCVYSYYSDERKYRYCDCDVSQNSFSNVVSATLVGCKV